MFGKFIKWLTLEKTDKLIRVKSWWPTMGRHGIEWPEMLIDTRGGQRQSCAPVWDRVRLLELLRRFTPSPLRTKE